MDARVNAELIDFLGMQLVGDGGRWRFRVNRHLATKRGVMYGGAGLAAALCGLELSTQFSVVWATAQYLRPVRVDDFLEVSVEVVADGRGATQARSTLVQADSGEPTLIAAAALVPLSEERRDTWIARWLPSEMIPPAVQHCEVGSIGEMLQVTDAFDVERHVPTADLERQSWLDGGRAAFWLVLPGGERVPDAADLALAADVIGLALPAVSGSPARWISLDNTVRVAHRVPTSRVLVEVQFSAIANGIAHGASRLWTESGELLGTASQSLAMRG